MSLIQHLLEKPSDLSTASRYTVMNGTLYLGAGVLMIAWPGMVQTLFQGCAVRRPRGCALPGHWSIACSRWLVLSFRRSFRGASTRRRFCYRPIDIRSADISPLGVRGSVPPFAGDVRDDRSLTGNWCLGSPQSKGLTDSPFKTVHHSFLL